jgi:hypothetical protein
MAGERAEERERNREDEDATQAADPCDGLDTIRGISDADYRMCT